MTPPPSGSSYKQKQPETEPEPTAGPLHSKKICITHWKKSKIPSDWHLKKEKVPKEAGKTKVPT
jgi:hypothetical protein